MLWVHRSNRLEELVSVLLEYLSDDRPHPLQKQPIVVQGAGMDRYLAQRLAAHFGIWANASFPFPRNFFEYWFAQAGIAPVEGGDPYAVEDLTWAIAQLLPQMWSQPAFEPLLGYARALAEPQDTEPGAGLAREHLALAHRLARVFDRYVVYRADLLHSWERLAPRDDWQCQLWRALTEHLAAPHFAARAKQWVERLGQGNVPLPARVYFFNLLHLPPLYVELLGQLGRSTEVHLFLLSPSREYWAEIRARRKILQENRALFGSVQQLEEAWKQAVGNPLLASLGRLGGELQAVLEGTLDYQDSDRYQDPAENSLLHVLQADMFSLQRRAADGSLPPYPLGPSDRSVQVHSCHSPKREVEVLHDLIRDSLEADPSLRPEDCLVLCPDLATYAPLIHATFGNPLLGERAIPYHVADQPLRSTDELVDALFAALDLLRGRAPSSAVLGLLARPPVRARFGVSAEDMDRLRQWIEETRVHWGFDATHREEEGWPPIAEHTWEFGLQRLFLGAAMAADERRLYQGVLPYNDVEGDGAELAGKLAEFCHRLRTFRARMAGKKPVAEWTRLLDELRTSLFATQEPYSSQHRSIREQLREIERAAQRARFSHLVELEAVTDRLASLLEERARPYGFLAGGVNFCALRSTRCIPARVVCLLGLSENSFPRNELPLPHDRLTSEPRPGDPNPREEDRYTFLLALLSARDRFIVTYCGQDLRNNAALPPATVVQELLDTIDESCRTDSASPAHQHVLVKHPLHPFSPKYFRREEGPWFSFSPSLCRAAESLSGPRAAPELWFPEKHELPPWSEPELPLPKLVSFFRHPQRELLRTRFEIRSTDEGFTDLDQEPIELDSLQEWQLGTFLLECRLNGMHPEESLDYARAAGLLPPGRLGGFALEEVRATVEALVQAVAKNRSGKALPAVPLALPFTHPRGSDAEEGNGKGSLLLTGRLPELWKKAQVLYTFSKIERGEELRAWLLHLALNCLPDRALPKRTVLVGRSTNGTAAVLHFAPVREARALLQELTHWFCLGMRAPLPFALRASRACAEQLAGGKDRKESERAAEARLVERFDGGEAPADPAFLLLYGTHEPRVEDLDARRPRGSPRFAELAQKVFSPLWEHSSIAED